MRADQDNLAASHKLISTNIGKPYTYSGLMSMLYRAIKAANKTRERKGIETKIESFGFRDLRAKADTDKTESSDIRSAQFQLGHGSITMTEHYVRKRKGQRVSPAK